MSGIVLGERHVVYEALGAAMFALGLILLPCLYPHPFHPSFPLFFLHPPHPNLVQSNFTVTAPRSPHSYNSSSLNTFHIHK
ncbi:uncharacterized protein N7500_005845 [Penicillium coprophilum]|uniref:uncharacterized protein n=1 Tax=Penicillium coprophilum TaxID=36646 RepID=UPI0023A6F52E|nr:uncharacterized protein N7500_005845 [Penicillium coprophilum]KAJ5164015.1 hypothetical protein N7500_005845 [Penicillium coprophilum]